MEIALENNDGIGAVHELSSHVLWPATESVHYFSLHTIHLGNNLL